MDSKCARGSDARSLRPLTLFAMLALFAVPALAGAHGLPTVTLTATDASASEVGPDPGVFTFTRTGGNLAAPLTVSYTLSSGAPGAAQNNVDYQIIPNTIVIPADALSATRTITPLADNLAEGPETVILTLSASASYLIGTPSTDTVTIADDAAVVTLAATNASASELGLDPGVFSGIFVHNQFGPEQLNVTKEEEICVPSSVINSPG